MAITIVFVTDGTWGSGQGMPLAAAQADGNLYALKAAIEELQAGGPAPESIGDIVQTADTIRILGTDGTDFGSFALPKALPAARGEWAAAQSYAVLDTVVAPAGETGAGSGYMCAQAHTAGTWADDLAAGKWTLYVTGAAGGGGGFGAVKRLGDGTPGQDLYYDVPADENGTVYLIDIPDNGITGDWWFIYLPAPADGLSYTFLRIDSYANAECEIDGPATASAFLSFPGQAVTAVADGTTGWRWIEHGLRPAWRSEGTYMSRSIGPADHRKMLSCSTWYAAVTLTAAEPDAVAYPDGLEFAAMKTEGPNPVTITGATIQGLTGDLVLETGDHVWLRWNYDLGAWVIVSLRTAPAAAIASHADPGTATTTEIATKQNAILAALRRARIIAS